MKNKYVTGIIIFTTVMIVIVAFIYLKNTDVKTDPITINEPNGNPQNNRNPENYIDVPESINEILIAESNKQNLNGITISFNDLMLSKNNELFITCHGNIDYEKANKMMGEIAKEIYSKNLDISRIDLSGEGCGNKCGWRMSPDNLNGFYALDC